MNRRVLFTGLISVFLTACAVATPIPTEIPPTQIFPTPLPTFTPTAALPKVELRAKAEIVNCRFGPGTVYDLVNELPRGQSARVVGRNESFTWWYVRDPGNPNGFCWVSSDVTEIDGETEKLPVQPAPPVKITKTTLRAEPTRIVIGCDQFPQTIFLEAEVTTNGPTFVTWKWEASTGVSSQEAIMVFERAGTQLINDYYQIGAPGDYWIKLHLLTPDQLTREVKIPVNCTP